MKTVYSYSSRIKSMALILTAVTFVLCVFAFICGTESYADAYKYKVTIYSGSQGSFNGKTVWSKEFDQGEKVFISLSDLGFKIKDKRYYARGFKIAGHDNDETTGFQTLTFTADSDVEYIVAYGIKGALVSYTAKYVDKDGREIHEPDTYYGMAGDKPVVSFRYIDGWEPDTYNIAKTLSKDESKNVLTFIYTRPGEGGGNGENEGGNGGNGAQAAVPAAPGTPQNPAGTNVTPSPGEDGETIDDTPVPTTDSGENGNGNKQYTDIDDNDTPQSAPVSRGLVIGGSLFGAALLLMLILLIIRRKKKAEEA